MPKELAEAKQAVLKGVKEITEVLARVSDSALRDTLRIDMGARHVSLSLGRILSVSSRGEENGFRELFSCSTQPVKRARRSTSRWRIGMCFSWKNGFRFCTESKLVDAELKDFLVERSTKDREIVYENFAAPAKSKI